MNLTLDKALCYDLNGRMGFFWRRDEGTEVKEYQEKRILYLHVLARSQRAGKDLKHF